MPATDHPGPPRSIWPRLAALIEVKPRSCICPYELSHDAARYVLKYQLIGCPWHTGGTR
jgi:hypothetical protein